MNDVVAAAAVDLVATVETEQHLVGVGPHQRPVAARFGGREVLDMDRAVTRGALPVGDLVGEAALVGRVAVSDMVIDVIVDVVGPGVGGIGTAKRQGAGGPDVGVIDPAVVGWPGHAQANVLIVRGQIEDQLVRDLQVPGRLVGDDVDGVNDERGQSAAGFARPRIHRRQHAGRAEIEGREAAAAWEKALEQKLRVDRKLRAAASDQPEAQFGLADDALRDQAGDQVAE